MNETTFPSDHAPPLADTDPTEVALGTATINSIASVLYARGCGWSLETCEEVAFEILAELAK